MKLKDIRYPAFFIIYGPGKDYITKYNRSEYADYYYTEMVDDKERALQIIKDAHKQYHGPSSSLKVRVVSNKIETNWESETDRLVLQENEVEYEV